MSPAKRISGRHGSLGAMPRSYQVKPAILGRWRATQRDAGQAKADSQYLSQPVTSPGPHRSGRTSTVRHTDDDSEPSIPRGAWRYPATISRTCSISSAGRSTALRIRAPSRRVIRRVITAPRTRKRPRFLGRFASSGTGTRTACARSRDRRCRAVLGLPLRDRGIHRERSGTLPESADGSSPGHHSQRRETIGVRFISAPGRSQLRASRRAVAPECSGPRIALAHRGSCLPSPKPSRRRLCRGRLARS
jgi:hypothetical protein